METIDTKRGVRRLGALALALAGAASLLGAYAVHGSMMSQSVVKLPYEKEINTRLWLPEGWKFFTRDPQDAIAHVFRLHDGVWEPAMYGQNGQARFAFGFDRAPRAQNVELGVIMRTLPPSAWMKCDASPAACASRPTEAWTVRNPGPRPTLCGTLAIDRQPPVPWAFLRVTRPFDMPSDVVRVEVTC